MTDDLNTKDLNERELLELIRQDQLALLEQVADLNKRVATLETRTNPLPPNYDERFAALETAVGKLQADLKEIKIDLRQLPKREWEHGRTLSDLEQRVETLEEELKAAA